MYTNSPCTSKVSKNIFLWGKTSPTKKNIWLLAAALLAARYGVDKSQTQTYTLLGTEEATSYFVVNCDIQEKIPVQGFFFLCQTMSPFYIGVVLLVSMTAL